MRIDRNKYFYFFRVCFRVVWKKNSFYERCLCVEEKNPEKVDKRKKIIFFGTQTRSKKNIRESPRLMREKLTEFAEQALVTQVSNLPLIFIDYSFVFVSQSSVSVHFFRSKNKRQINLVSSRVER